MSTRQGSGVTSGPRAPASMVYEEFSPTSEWKEEDQSRVLLVYLPGFRKEQLRVATQGTNSLRVRGERFIGGRKRSRFEEEYQIPTDSTIQGINAKFETGILTITMPKINSFQEGIKAEEAKTTQSSQETVEKPKDEALDKNTGIGEPSKTTLTPKKEEDEQKFENPMKKKDEHETALENTPKELPESGENEKGNENVGSKVENLKKAMNRLADGGLKAKRAYIVNVGVAAIVIVALGVYISYTFGFYDETSNP